MAKLTYITNVSLDGFIEDASGDFQFTEPTDEAFVFITDLIGNVGTWLYGRRLYEAMAVWETDASIATQSARNAAFARAWQRGDKVVYSTTLPSPVTERTTIERTFDTDAIRALKTAATSDLTIGGAQLAAHAFAAGLVDEVHLFVAPVTLGAGKPGLPQQRVALELVDQHHYTNGAVYLRYRVIK